MANSFLLDAHYITYTQWCSQDSDQQDQDSEFQEQDQDSMFQDQDQDSGSRLKLNDKDVLIKIKKK